MTSDWRRWACGAAILASTLVTSGPAVHAAVGWRERFVDPEDGAVDASEYLLTHRGLLPVPIIVTEPALGFGGGLAALWFKESLGDARAQGEAEWGRMTPPTIAGVAGFGTENGSWGAAGVYFAPFAGDRYRYLGALAKVGLELDYYGASGRRIGYSLDGDALVQQLLARIGKSDWFVGGRYVYFGATSRFDFSLPIEIPKSELDTRIGRLSLIVNYDSRDNIFTPSRGTYMETELMAARQALGGTVDFESLYARAFHYIPLGSAWVVGLRGDVRLTSEGTPFFAKPFVSLRGVPALRYQDDRTAVAEVELRWNVSSRWAVVGFAGAGRAFGERTDWGDAETIVSKGFGFRYLVARKLGLYGGLDFAWGPEDRAFYVQVGSAWR